MFFQKICINIFLLLLVLGVAAQSLPLDPAVRKGVLPNGFTYYIRHNTEPAKRAQLYLVVKAGSILEADNQRGLAHFMEHMSFNGTKHFPKNKLVEYLQQSGIRFGADLNAYTGFDETVYQLPIPTNNKELFRNGIQIMRDWAQDATLDPEEINRERGVVIEEKRLRKGADQRLQDQSFPVSVNHSRYAYRLPIGTEEVLTTFTPATIRSFYKDWYRPDLQALIVVGDVDVKEVEQLIRTKFSDLRLPAAPKPRTPYSIPLNGKSQFISVTDPECPQTVVQVMTKRRAQPIKTVSDYKRGLTTNLFSYMLAARLGELAQKPAPPFRQLGGGVSGFPGGVEMLNIQLVSRDGELQQGFAAAWTAINRIKRLGFVASELERAKTSLRTAMAARLKEKDKINSAELVAEYQQHFLGGHAAPGLATEAQLLEELLPSITLELVNACAAGWLQGADRDIVVFAPESARTQVPAEKTVNDWIAAAEAQPLTPYEDNVATGSLLPALPIPGKIVQEKSIPEIGVTEYTLSNGAKVVLKPTTFKNDEIHFTAFSRGGMSLYSDADYPSAAMAAGAVAGSGLGSYDPITLPKMLNGKMLSVMPFIGETGEGIRGGSGVKDLETALQVIYLYFTAPRKDTIVFDNIMRQNEQAIANRYTDIRNVFADTVTAVLGNYHPRRTGPTLSKLKQVSFDRAFSIYRERFANAGDFTFFFVGNFHIDSIRPLLEQYIASLPGLPEKETARDLGIRTPKGALTKTVYKGKEDKATVQLTFSGDFPYSAAGNVQFTALREVLQFRLVERLRETEGGVYTPSVQLGISKIPAARYQLSIYFGCAPANVEKLIAATFEEINRLKKEGPPANDLIKYKEEGWRQLELAVKENQFWLSSLLESYMNEEEPRQVLRQRELLEQLSSGSVQEAARLYLNEQQCIRFIWLPEQ